MSDKTYKEKLASLRTFIFDVDGVFTDNRIILYADVDPVRTFYTRDAYAVQHAIKEGLRIIIISGGKSPGVLQSLQRLGIEEIHMATSNKLELFERLVAEGLDPATTAYMGDDIPDMRVMQRVAFPCTPSDGAEEIKAVSAYISRFPGGGGCVRDLLEQTLKVQGMWMSEAAHIW